MLYFLCPAYPLNKTPESSTEESVGSKPGDYSLWSLNFHRNSLSHFILCVVAKLCGCVSAFRLKKCTHAHSAVLPFGLNILPQAIQRSKCGEQNLLWMLFSCMIHHSCFQFPICEWDCKMIQKKIWSIFMLPILVPFSLSALKSRVSCPLTSPC